MRMVARAQTAMSDQTHASPEPNSPHYAQQSKPAQMALLRQPPSVLSARPFLPLNHRHMTRMSLSMRIRNPHSP